MSEEILDDCLRLTTTNTGTKVSEKHRQQTSNWWRFLN